jgi:hypothetical protein
LFTETAVRGNGSIMHREGSGIVTLRGLTTQCRARFKVSFGANIAVPTGETVGPISLALAISGEAVPTSSMIETPVAVEDFSNVYSSLFIDVPQGCCVSISVENTSTIPVGVQNANLIVERVA